MPCYYPIQAYYGALRSNGKRKIVFKEDDREFGCPFFLPCGRCIGCRLERSRQWAIRIMHEAELHDSNYFVTLTYSDENLPASGSLDVEHFKLFMKRLRKHFGNGIRYFHCGEYGFETRRPHYHACLFNIFFEDAKFYKKTRAGYNLYTSEVLDELWSYGHCNFGSLSFDSAAYVARYIVDKVVGRDAEDHYYVKETGVHLNPEYVTMSRRPGIGSKWLDLFKDDVYSQDHVVVNGRSMKPPKFYDSKLELVDSDLFYELKERRSDVAMKYSDDQTPERLAVREKCRLAKLALFKRNGEI